MMDKKELINNFWSAVAAKKKEPLSRFFNKDAIILWPNTNEQFTLMEYLTANCDYPGLWNAVVKKIDQFSSAQYCSITEVSSVENNISFHTISYFTFSNNKIVVLEEYWSENGPVPEWRKKLRLGIPIK